MERKMHLKTLCISEHNINEWKVIFHDDFVPEYGELPESVQDVLVASTKILREKGPLLGRPQVDTLKDSRHANMKELRFYADGRVWRVAFAFDPERKAILLVAGDKGGVAQRRFYSELILVADRRFDQRRASFTEKEIVMPVTLDEILNEMSPERRARIEKLATEMRAEMNLREVRRLRKLTQARLSKKLKIGQEGVSRIEKRSDLYISTLRNYVEGVGGELTLMVSFPNQPPVFLRGLGENTVEMKAKKKARTTAKSKPATRRAA